MTRGSGGREPEGNGRQRLGPHQAEFVASPEQILGL